MSQFLLHIEFCELTQYPQTLHDPAHEARRRPTDPRRATQKTTSLPPSRNLPHANKLLYLTPQPNHWFYTLWWLILLWSCIPGLPTLWLAFGYCYTCCGIWVIASGREDYGESDDGFPVDISWDQWRGTSDMGYGEQVSEEADCITGRCWGRTPFSCFAPVLWFSPKTMSLPESTPI